MKTPLTLTGSITWTLPPTAIRATADAGNGQLRATVEMVRPGPINDFLATKEFIDATEERWDGTVLSVIHDMGARVDLVVGEVGNIRIEPETHALLGDLLTDPTEAGRQMAYQIKAGRASFSIGAMTPEIHADDVGKPSGPWRVINAEPDHLMVTRKNKQAQPDANVRGIFASAQIEQIVTGGSGDLTGQLVPATGTAGTFGRFLLATLVRMEGNDKPRSKIEENLIDVAGIERSRLEDLIRGSAMPTLDEMRAFSQVLWVDLEELMVRAEASGADLGVVEAAPEDLRPSLTAARARRVNPYIPLQGDSPPDTQVIMTTEAEKQKALEAKIENLAAKVTSLEAEQKVIATDRDKWKGLHEATLIAAAVKDVHSIEADMGKQEKELTDFKDKSLADVEAARMEALQAYRENPPKQRGFAPVTPSPRDIQASAPATMPTEVQPLFGSRSSSLHSTRVEKEGQ